MKRIIATMLFASMICSNMGVMNIHAQEGQSAVQQPMELTKVELTEEGVETERTSEDVTLLEIYHAVKAQAPTLNEDYSKIILPSTGNDIYSISLYGSSNHAVIDLDGNVTQPIEDMKVYLYYQVTNTETGESLHMDDPVCIYVNGKYDDTYKDINRPEIFPAIREWKGDEGTFSFNGNIVLADDSLNEAANVVKEYLEDVTEADIAITTGEAQAGDIYLAWDDTLSVGAEGYVLDIDDILEVTATEYTGIVYAGTTISQMFMNSADGNLPKGIMRDYPQYEYRGLMLDLGRFYMPLDYLEEVTKYAAFFKMNELHAHINDNGGEQSHAFRVESKRYPAINSGISADHVYSQEDYKAYQKEVKRYGIDVVTEIDTPAHAKCINAVDSSIMLNSSHINIENPDAVALVKNLYDEFLDGDDPVFQSDKFHIGIDEYTYTKAEQVRAYIDEMSKYIAGKGLEPIVWCSLNDTPPTGSFQGYGGETPVTNLGVQEFYSKGTADLQLLLEGEYKIISAEARSLYIVPGTTTNFFDYLDLENLYNNWEVGDITPEENTMKPGHPLLIGAESCLWYDKNIGCSEFDIFDRCKGQILIMAEKNWYGENAEDASYEEFADRINTLGNITPAANPARYVESASNKVASYKFDALEGTKVKDLSVNGYDAEVSGLNVNNEKNALELNESGYVSLPFDSMGYPYYVNFALEVSENIPENAALFEGKDGALYFNIDGTGKIGFVRKGFTYIFDYVVPADVMLNYRIECHDKNTYLYVEDTLVAQAVYVRSVYGYQTASESGHPTFVLPTEKIGAGLIGYLKSLDIKQNPGFGALDMSENVALNKTVTLSGIEGGYKEDGTLVYPKFEPIHAVDGNAGTVTSLDNTTGDEQWIQVDLGKEYLINKVAVSMSSTTSAFDMQYSLDGNEWHTISSRTGIIADAGVTAAVVSSYTDELEETAIARYVRFYQTKRWYNSKVGKTYSAAVKEIEAYGIEYDVFVSNIKNEILGTAKKLAASTAVTPENEKFLSIFKNEIAELEAVMEAVNAENYSEILRLASIVSKHIEDLENGNTAVLDTDKTVLKLLLAEEYDLSVYNADVVQEYKTLLEMGTSIYNDLDAAQEVVDYIVKKIQNARYQLISANVALKKTVTVSGFEGGYKEDGTLTYPKFAAAHAVDGKTSTVTSLDYTTGDEQWILVDLGKEYWIYKFVANMSSTPYAYDMQYSVDGETWYTISSRTGLVPEAGASKGVVSTHTDELEDFVCARYVRFYQTKRWYFTKSSKWLSTAMRELEAYGCEKVDFDQLYEAVRDAEALVSDIYTAESYVALEEALESVQNINVLSTQEDVDSCTKSINDTIAALKYKGADYTAVEEAIAKIPADLTIYTEETVNAVNNAVAAVVYGKDVMEQDAVNAMAQVIEEAIANLKEIVFEIVRQPESAMAKKGMDASVTVEATGKGLTYTWYYKNPGNKKFYESGSDFVSADGTTYTMPMYAWRDGQEVYCEITDANGLTLQTNIVTLSMDNGSIKIVKQPEDVAVDVVGGEAVVTVEATGTDLTYQWYYKNPGNVKFYVSGDQFVSEDGATYTIPVAAWRDGQEVYCVITDANGISVQTNTVTLSVAK